MATWRVDHTDYKGTSSDELFILYTCENCDREAFYHIPVTASSHSMSDKYYTVNDKDKAKLMQEALTNLASTKLDTIAKKQFRSQRCPHCGYYQSWMITYQKNDRLLPVYIGLGGISIVFACFGSILITLPANLGLQASGILTALGVLALPFIVPYALYKLHYPLYNPNRKFGTVAKVNAPTVWWSGENPRNITRTLSPEIQRQIDDALVKR